MAGGAMLRSSWLAKKKEKENKKLLMWCLFLLLGAPPLFSHNSKTLTLIIYFQSFHSPFPKQRKWNPSLWATGQACLALPDSLQWKVIPQQMRKLLDRCIRITGLRKAVLQEHSTPGTLPDSQQSSKGMTRTSSSNEEGEFSCQFHSLCLFCLTHREHSNQLLTV